MRLLAIAPLTIAVCAAVTARAGDGASLFVQNCVMCHQSGGTGIPGQFPRLAGRVRRISLTPSGRAYLIDVLTYGMTGTIIIDGDSISGLMPPFPQLSDADAADILNYVQTLDDPATKQSALFTLGELSSGRSRPAKTPAKVFVERQALQHAGLIP